jgi:hypothetical protein
MAGGAWARVSSRAHPAVSWGQTIPRQHGAWSVLLLGFVLGVGAGGAVGVPALLLLVSVVCAMPLRHVAAMWLRVPPGDARRQSLLGWGAMYALLAALPLILLLLVYHLWLLVPLGALAVSAGLAMTLLERARRDRTLWGEMAGMVGLSASVPAAGYVSGGVLDPRVMAVWLLAVLVFCGGVLHVRHVVRRGNRTGAVSVSFHILALGVAAGIGQLGLIPQFAFLALLPAVLRSIWPLLQPAGRKVPVRRLGLEELGYGAVFVLLAVLLLHL